MYNQYSEILNDNLKNTDQLIKDISDTINKNSSSIMTTINNAAKEFGTTVSSSIKNIVTNKDGVEKGVDKAQESSETTTKKVDDKSDAQATKNVTSATNTTTKTTSAEKTFGFLVKLPTNKRVSATNKKKLNKNTSIVDRLKYFDFYSSESYRKKYYAGMGLGKQSSYTGTDKQNKAMINWLKANGYKKGVYNLNKDQYAFTQEIAPEAIVRKDGSVLMPLTAGTSVLNGNATKNFYDFMNNPLQYMNDLMNKEVVSANPNVSNANTTIESNIQLTLNLPSVTNYEDFKNKMVKDKDFEKRIQAMSVDLLAGKSALSKYKK